jgi:hypothetical protein
MPELWTVRAGTVPYRRAWAWQRALAERRAAGDIPDTVLLLEHPHVYTIGKRGSDADVLADPAWLTANGAEVVRSDRGGQVTYHGPGQLVGYPITLLDPTPDIWRFVGRVEQALQPAGGQRPLGIPCIRDRVVEMAMLMVLGPIFEADLPPQRFGFRPERDAKMAVRRAFWHITDHGRTEVVDADLSDYFASIPHGSSMRCVSRRVADGTILAVIKGSAVRRSSLALVSATSLV